MEGRPTMNRISGIIVVLWAVVGCGDCGFCVVWLCGCVAVCGRDG